MKYLKYKKKYLELYKQTSGNPTKILYHGTNLYFIDYIKQKSLSNEFPIDLYDNIKLLFNYYNEFKRDHPELSLNDPTYIGDALIRIENYYSSKKISLSLTGNISTAIEYSTGARKGSELITRILRNIKDIPHEMLDLRILEIIKRLDKIIENPGIILAIKIDEVKKYISENPSSNIDVQILEEIFINKVNFNDTDYEYRLEFHIPPELLYIVKDDKVTMIKLLSAEGDMFIKSRKHYLSEFNIKFTIPDELLNKQITISLSKLIKYKINYDGTSELYPDYNFINIKNIGSNNYSLIIIKTANIDQRTILDYIPSKKYFKDLTGGTRLTEMPQLCFGTVQDNISEMLPIALKLGYRHIDGANNYEGHSDYYEIIKMAIKSVPRNQLWITWKMGQPTYSEIERVIKRLDCEYIDLFLIHHGCGSDKDFIELKKAQDNCLINYYGVSNCEDINKLRDLKIKYNIYANQVQSRPPTGLGIRGRLSNPENFNDLINQSNDINIKIMLFASISGYPGDELLSNINKYYIQKYISRKGNVLMVSSTNTFLKTLENNLYIFNEQSHTPLIESEMLRIEQKLESRLLYYMY